MLGVLECGGDATAHGSEDVGLFMERCVGIGSTLMVREPGIPGGGTPPFTAGETPAATDDLLTGHEPRSEEWSGRPSSRPSPGGRRSLCAAGFVGLTQVFAGTSRDSSRELGLGMSPQVIRDSLSLRERVGVREPVSALATACTGSHLLETNLLMVHEAGIPWGGTPAATDVAFMERTWRDAA